MVACHTRRQTLQAGVSLAGAIAGGGCLSGRSSSTDDVLTLRVGSKTFIESDFLGHLCIELLKERDDASIINRLSYSSPTLGVWKGLTSGEIDVYWEYSGTLWHEIPPNRDTQYYELDEMYRHAKTLTEDKYDVEVLSMAPFNNSYSLITTEAWADRTGVRSVSDFAAYLNAGNTDTVAGVSPGTYEREDAWPGMLSHYDIRRETIEEWDEKRQNVLLLPTGEIYSRLVRGSVNVALRFTSDPQIEHYDLVVLDDDGNYWSVYSPAPVVPAWLSADYPEIHALLDQLGPAIGGVDTIRRLTSELLFDDRDASEVAREFLAQAGLL
ncbi:glycine betaine ABC transporter substrate-binding protein [Halovenus rubra]|uniref:Glycine betaine ABC transporter substrate-binding protein n=2 Tax=Halovenus rubra TaxID=869890 RepID=A0ACC7E2T0_9EURY|nr:glycine betaine ABC transporter substrate-binding protein [Halovenus rubra]